MMAVELRNRISASGVHVALHVVVGAATAADLAAGITGRARVPHVDTNPSTSAPLHSHLAAAFVGAVAGAVLVLGWTWLFPG